MSVVVVVVIFNHMIMSHFYIFKVMYISFCMCTNV